MRRGRDGRPPALLRLRLPLLIGAMSLPFLLPSAYVDDLAQAAAADALLALGYFVVQGLCGQFSVAHAALYGVGAYTTAVLTVDHGVGSAAALAASVLAGALAGALVGLPALRLRGDQLAVVTLFVGGVAQVVMENWTSLTHGLGGIPGVPPSSLGGVDVITLRGEYLLTAGAVVITVLGVERLRRHGLGLAMAAVREDELAARVAGVRVGVVKVAAFAVSGAIAGVAGWIYAGRYVTVTPDTFDVTLSVFVAAMVLLAGPGRTYSVVAAAGLLGTAQRVLADHVDVQPGATGALILAVVLVRADVPRRAVRRLAARWRS